MNKSNLNGGSLKSGTNTTSSSFLPQENGLPLKVKRNFLMFLLPSNPEDFENKWGTDIHS